MSKRSLSPHHLPPAKRPHLTHTNPSGSLFSLADSLYDELILTILSYLSWVDLCTTQLINKHWSRLAADNELWRKQYLCVYGKPRLRGARGLLSRQDGREVKSLPLRARVDDYKDWKWMFRISSNWRKGRCSVEHFQSAPRAIPSLPTSSFKDNYQSHLLLAGPLIITASSRPSHEPIVYISGPMGSRSLICRSRQSVRCNITALAIDQSPPVSGGFSVILFLSTGEFMGYRIKHNSSSAPPQVFSYTPAAARSHSHPVIQAVYHHPLLVTLSQDFTISLYNLEFDAVKLTQTLSSFTSFPPVSLVLSTPTPSTYKLVLAYAVPVYPRHWTVGATELIISGRRAVSVQAMDPPSFPSAEDSYRPEDMTVLSTRTARAIDVPFGWIDERKFRTMREQWSRKVIRVADIQTDGKWVILAPGDQLPALEHHLPSPAFTPESSNPSPNSGTDIPDDIVAANAFTAPSLHSPTSLQLYRLILPPQNSISSSPPRLSFVRTLHGQTGPISALALSDGRCVSSGLNGSTWVWDLEAGTGVEVAAANLEHTHGLLLGPDAEPIKGSVSFDERRLIIVQGDNVAVRRFDI